MYIVSRNFTLRNARDWSIDTGYHDDSAVKCLSYLINESEKVIQKKQERKKLATDFKV